MDVDWIPADVLAKIVLDLAHRNHEGMQTYDLINRIIETGRLWSLPSRK